MTTLRARRTELGAALKAKGIRTTDDPNGSALPFALIVGDGVDTRHLVRGQVPASFRVILCAGAWDGTGTAATLNGMLEDALTALRKLAGWQVGEVTPDRTLTVAGAPCLTASVSVTANADI